MATRVIMMRHGKAESNKGLLTRRVGSHANLLPEGIRQYNSQIMRVAKYVTSRVIYASPKPRCQQSAAILAEHLNWVIKTDDRLDEIYKGDWEGQTVEDVMQWEAEVDIDDRPLFRPPNGENWPDVAERGVNFLTDLIKRPGDHTYVAVTHNHVIKMTIGRLLDVPLPEWEAIPVRHAEMNTLVYDNGGWNIDMEISPQLAAYERDS